ncbi:MAG TPA: DUF190 domain-containing protein [Burkholderiales bacterium]|nr:DUF190 domain-containing protein [Burkholderiales bacterium]
MSEICLRLYAREGQRLQNRLLYDYLLESAHGIGATGGTVLRASAGFGRHGLREEVFFELGGELPVIVELVVTQAQADAMLALCREQQLSLFYTLTPVTAGITSG